MAERTIGIGGIPLPPPASPPSTTPSSASSSSSPSSSLSRSLPSSSSPSPSSSPSSSSSPPPLPALYGGLPVTSLELATVNPNEKLRERHWGEKLIYETGVCYFSGLIGGFVVGAGVGMQEIRKQPTLAPIMKLKLSRILNASAKFGAEYSQTFGVVALCYSMARTHASWWRNKEDLWNDGIGMGVAVGGNAYAGGYGTFRSVRIGTGFGTLMAAGLYARKTMIDERGKKLYHL